MRRDLDHLGAVIAADVGDDAPGGLDGSLHCRPPRSPAWSATTRATFNDRAKRWATRCTAKSRQASGSNSSVRASAAQGGSTAGVTCASVLALTEDSQIVETVR